jgi:nucleoside-diphosphate-sugar epimerase
MNTLKGKNIVVTGGYGFLGQNLVEDLEKKDVGNIFVPRHSEYDLTEMGSIKRMFRDSQPDIVVHLAATVGGIGFLKKSPGTTFYNNTMMGVQLLELSRKFDVEKVALIGTTCSYPKITEIPFKEEALWTGYPDETTGYYGISKLLLHVQADAYKKQYGLNSIYLIPTNLYGPKDNFDPKTSHVIPALIRKIIEAKKENLDYVNIWGTGEATRDFLYVKDATDGIIKAIERYNKILPVNLGSGNEISIKDLTQKIMKLVSYEGEIKFDPTKPEGQPRRCLDISRAKKEFGFIAKTKIEEGLKETIEWFQENKIL